jgi:uncharacterized membrane protein
LPALDAMRGLVMMLMSVDHASDALNAGRFFTDAAFMWKPGTPIPAAQFFTRWVTHLCAPTFVFLAGAALALSTESRLAKGQSPREVDMHIVKRGLLLVLLDVVWMSPAFIGPGNVLLQVLYAIGTSLLAMTLLRRLSGTALLAVGLALIVLGEALIGALFAAGAGGTIPTALFAGGGEFFHERFVIAYPTLPWLGIMCLGWALGRKLLAWNREGRVDRAPRVLATWGVASLLVFAVVRGANEYGNMLLYRDDASVLQWLHVSKYPPSLAFTSLELGIAALLLAGFFVLFRRAPERLAPLRLFGQVALFYYLLHAHIVTVFSLATGWHEKLGLASAWIGGAALVVVLYPACKWYRAFKAARPKSLLQYI